jgi:hypothetical protein
MSNTAMMHLRPLALSLALGLSAVGFASTAFAGQQTTWYDKWPEIQAQMQAQAGQQQAFAAQTTAPAVTDAYGASFAAPQIAATAAVNGAGEHIDHNGIPVLQDRGMEH